MKFVLTLAGDTLTGQITRERDGQQQTAKLDLKRENRRLHADTKGPLSPFTYPRGHLTTSRSQIDNFQARTR